MANHFYAREKMIEALSVLATHPGGIKERLSQASLRFLPIGEDIPEPFRSDFGWIAGELTKLPSEEGEGAVEATLSAMLEEHAVEIARRIDELEYKLRQAE